MAVTVTIVRGGREEKVVAEKGALLCEVLTQDGRTFDLPCGGKGTCMRCRVLARGELSPTTDVETEGISAEDLERGVRLACLACAEGDVRVEPEVDAIFENIVTASNTVSYEQNPLYEKWGVAVDIGTTTVCVQLFGPQGLTQTVSMKNPQTAYGADVISRIEHALAGELTDLAVTIRTAIVRMVLDVAGRQGIDVGEIDTLVVTGNTTMLYLFAEHTPETLSHAPFDADRLFGEFGTAGDFGIDCIATARLYLPRCMSAFVGADITTAVLASGMCSRDETALLIDIGTNGEIALRHGGTLYCSSTAAGPAFEGVGISMGVYGIKGAIDKVWLEGGAVHCSTIDNQPAVGICGSGIVDAIAVMLEAEVIDETGAFQIDEDEYDLGGGITVTAQDVRQVQLAKGSIRAGVETLLDTAGVSKDMVKRLYIAGGFGNYLNLKNAAGIGLVPEELLERTETIGNAALAGAAMLLCNKDFIPEADAFAVDSQTVALDGNPMFRDYYMEHMMFE